jgi:hypothetical protein
MRFFTLSLIVTLFSCGKKDCQTCTSYKVVTGGTTVRNDTVYKDVEYCGKDLENAKSKQGSSSTTQVGSTTYKVTTMVNCH